MERLGTQNGPFLPEEWSVDHRLSLLYHAGMQYQTIEIYTDGGCSGNPGPGGWAFTLTADGVFSTELSGGEGLTTNNRMELTAVIRALEYARRLGGQKIIVNTDSQYVRNGILQWVASWKRKGWKTADNKPVKNREYWEELDGLVSGMHVSFNWVKGHDGIELNEKCDQMVQMEIRRIKEHE
jgi:ribonuclease HI